MFNHKLEISIEQTRTSEFILRISSEWSNPESSSFTTGKMPSKGVPDSLSERAGPLRLTPFPLENLLYPPLEGVQKTRHLYFLMVSTIKFLT
jgi:hypothetical protein